jgi:TPR repeat protein
LSVPIYDFAQANEELANMETKHYYSCCGKTICGGCVDSFCKSGNDANCPYCKSEQYRKTDEERVEEMMKRVEANDAGSILMLAGHYEHGSRGLRQDSARAMELYTRAAELGSSDANFALGLHYHKGGDMKKAKFRLEAEAMAGHEVARNNLGIMEAQSGNMERAVKHWIIAASGGNHNAMYNLQKSFELGFVGEV